MANKSTEPVIQRALERFEESQDQTNHNREAAYEDIRFARLGEQWDETVSRIRADEGRPCLVVNKLPAFIRQVVNDARQNKPATEVGPVDDDADEDTAEIFSGLIRAIERNCNADVAYDTAVDHACTNGFGFWQIGIDYTNEDSFDLEAKIYRVPNPLMVHWDAATTEFDASDWQYCFVSDFLTETEYEFKYPDAKKISWQGDTRDGVQYWLDDEKIRIADYWERTEKKRKILQLSNGVVVREEDWNDKDNPLKALAEADGVTVERDREAHYHTVKRYRLNMFEVLEEEEWPGQYIPVVPVWGEEIFVDGRRYLRSMVADATDPQRMFNFWRSASTELVALAPRAPWLMSDDALPKDDSERQRWETANTRSHPYLLYNKQASAPPQRQPFAGIPAGAIQEALNASDDMKAIIGIYDAGLGARSNETSGRAIIARQREADVSNYHFIDNLSRAIQYSGRVLVDIIPKVYNARQTIRILGPDMREEVVEFYQLRENQQYERTHDLSVGKYDVTVKSGPSYSTQREETRETLISIMQNVKGAAAVLGDVLMDHMDFAGADKIAKRLKVLLPPAVQAVEAAEDVEGLPDDLKGVAGQALAQIRSLQQQLKEAEEGSAEKRMEIEADVRMHREKMSVEREKMASDRQTKVQIAEIDARAKMAPSVSLSLSDAGEQAFIGQGQRVEAALEALAAAVTALAGPRAVQVTTSSGRTLRGTSAPTMMQ